MKYLILSCLIAPFFLTAQHPVQISNDYILIAGPFNIGTVQVDSFMAVSKVKKMPTFTISMDSMQKRIFYPQMERDNLIGGDLYGYFRVTQTGSIDSVWLDGNIYPGINKEVTRFLKTLPPIKPARKRGKNVPCICRLAFHFRVKEQ